MIETISKKRLLISLIMILYLKQEASCSESYELSFQTEIVGSFEATTDSWIEFSAPISSTKEFTVCHWLKIQYFGFNRAACIWAYCTVANIEEYPKCTQICLDGDLRTANRNLKLNGWIQLEKTKPHFSKPFDNYHHRTWFHLCWSLSTISGISKFYFNGIKIQEDQFESTANDWALYGSDKKLMTSLIFGQEPDSFRGDFDKEQAYLGSLAEFNIWNHTIKDDEILKMSLCKKSPQGNIVSWKESSWTLNAVGKRSIVKISELCEENPQYFIIPKKVRYPEARKLCEIHGGSLALPRSDNDADAILNVVSKHQNTCLADGILPENPAVWIGAKRFNYTWYEIGKSIAYESVGYRINYTKISTEIRYENTKCAYIRNDGSWIDIAGDFGCYLTSLCTVCEITNKHQPVFTLIGLCDVSDIDWDYYLDIDEQHLIKRYEGYKKTDFVYDNDSESWKIVPKEGYPSSFEASFTQNDLSTVSYPIGRNNWKYQDTICQVNDFQYLMSLSVCDFPNQFSCTSGHCIDINKRCNEKMDCEDGSDEEMCKLIEIPSSYSRANAPDSPTENLPMMITIRNRIISIDSIDTINMIVTLTMELRFEWFDKRLTYSNPVINKRNLISEQQSDIIWTPLRDIIHENAIIGEVVYDGDFIVEIHAISPGDLEPSKPIENRLFNGSSNDLIGTKRMIAKYNCEFDSKKFPFDEHDCSIILRMDRRKDEPIVFSNDGAILYDGKNVVGQFLIGKMSTEVRNTNESTRNILTIHMIRLYANQITITFVPTLVLWLFGYITLFIEPNEDGFSDRFVGAGTALLVIVTLLNAIHADLPKTSYMKYIDVWFLWHVISVFLMIAHQFWTQAGSPMRRKWMSRTSSLKIQANGLKKS